jgi:hypothetical protein
MDEQLEFVAYCGLYCGLCAGRSRIPQRATALQQAMADEGWNFWGQGIPGFPEFWQFLQGLADEGGCPGCRAGGGDPSCRIRICARERDLELCAHCPDFPCERVEAFGCRYPTLLADNRRLQAVGPVRWVSEQEERARRGVVYADTRYSAEVTE